MNIRHYSITGLEHFSHPSWLEKPKKLNIFCGCESSVWLSSYLLAEGIHKHPHGGSGPDHEGGVAACVPSKIHLKLLGRLQYTGEEDVAEFVDVE